MELKALILHIIFFVNKFSWTIDWILIKLFLLLLSIEFKIWMMKLNEKNTFFF